MTTNYYTSDRDNRRGAEQLRQAVREMLALSLSEAGLQWGRVVSIHLTKTGLMQWTVRIPDEGIALPEMATLIHSAFCSDVTLVEISHRELRNYTVVLLVNLSYAQEGMVQ